VEIKLRFQITPAWSGRGLNPLDNDLRPQKKQQNKTKTKTKQKTLQTKAKHAYSDQNGCLQDHLFPS